MIVDYGHIKVYNNNNLEPPVWRNVVYGYHNLNSLNATNSSVCSRMSHKLIGDVRIDRTPRSWLYIENRNQVSISLSSEQTLPM